MKPSALILATALAAIGAITTSAAHAADLMAVYREALSYDAALTAAKYSMQAGREKLPQARAGLLPSINFALTTGYNAVDAESPTPYDRGSNANYYTLKLTQPLFRWDRWVGYQQGEIQVGIAEAQYAVARNELSLRVVQSYFDVLYANDVLNAVQALKVATESQLKLAKKSFEVGTVTITDVNEAQAKLDITSAQEIAAANDLAVKRNALRVLTGNEPASLSKLREGVNVQPPLPADINTWVTAAENANPSVQAQILNAEFAKREISRQQAGHLPTLDLVAGTDRRHSITGSSGSDNITKNNIVELQLNIPIYSGGGVNSKVREAVALSDKSKSDLDNVRRNAAQLARQYYLGATSGIAQVSGYETAMKSSRSSVASNELGFEVGVRINIDVLNAQTQLAETYAKLQRARYDSIIALLRLKATTGSLSDVDFEQVNALLEP